MGWRSRHLADPKRADEIDRQLTETFDRLEASNDALQRAIRNMLAEQLAQQKEGTER